VSGGFENLIAWQKARELTRRIYAVTRIEPFAADYRLVSQIRAAAVSVMSNLAEGYERGGRGEFHKAIVTAKGECGEMRSQLYVALDQGYIESSVFESLYSLAMEESRILEGLRVQVAHQRSGDQGVVR
jgi:four helix bundle protein